MSKNKKSQSNQDSSWIIDNKLEITPQEIGELIEKEIVNKILNKNEL